MDDDALECLRERLLKRISGNVEGPVYQGAAPGELSIANSAVILQDQAWRVLRFLGRGVLNLPEDEYIDGRWVTQVDDHSYHRLELLLDLIASRFAAYTVFGSSDRVDVYRVSGVTECVPRDRVTVTDWLRILVRDQALTSVSEEYARDALAAITLRPNETWREAANRVLLAFRASLVDHRRPYTTEATYFWRLITTQQLMELYERIIEVISPAIPAHRSTLDSILHEKVAAIEINLEPFPNEWPNPMGQSMQLRGDVAQGLYDNFVGVLTTTHTLLRRHRRRSDSRNLGC